jgi:hypothetical protein
MPDDNTSKCAIHGVVEAASLSGVDCFECRHHYPTYASLQEAFWEVFADHSEEISTPVEFTFCPWCLHDFPFTIREDDFDRLGIGEDNC